MKSTETLYSQDIPKKFHSRKQYKYSQKYSGSGVHFSTQAGSVWILQRKKMRIARFLPVESECEKFRFQRNKTRHAWMLNFRSKRCRNKIEIANKTKTRPKDNTPKFHGWVPTYFKSKGRHGENWGTRHFSYSHSKPKDRKKKFKINPYFGCGELHLFKNYPF